jgi:hypothetical protein
LSTFTDLHGDCSNNSTVCIMPYSCIRPQLFNDLILLGTCHLQWEIRLGGLSVNKIFIVSGIWEVDRGIVVPGHPGQTNEPGVIVHFCNTAMQEV